MSYISNQEYRYCISKIQEEKGKTRQVEISKITYRVPSVYHLCIAIGATDETLTFRIFLSV